MLEGTTGLVVYLGLKLSGYLLWCYVGVRWLSPGARTPLFNGIVLGVGRLVLGWIVGALVAPFVLVAGALGHLPLFYFTGLGVIRWLEWGVIQALIPMSRSAPEGIITGVNARGRIWRSLGVIVSYLADAPFLITSGFPQGRFFC